MTFFQVNPCVPSFPLLREHSDDDSYVLKPFENAAAALSKHSYIELVPGAIYKWSGIKISRTVLINGRGAIIYLSGEGPIISIDFDDSGIAYDAHVSFVNCFFKESDATPIRDEAMNDSFMSHSAIWARNTYKISIEHCVFENFKGAAIWLYDTKDYVPNKTWSQQHIISSCRFSGCRFAIATGGACEYSIANNNCFYDCQICFYVIGGNWLRVGNLIVNCRSAYYHNQNGMWYQGPAGMHNPAHGSFVGNTLNHCDYAGNVWPNILTGADGSRYTLAGMYFNNSNTYPPTWTGNTQYYGDMVIDNFKAAQKTFCIVGCTLMGNPGQTVSSIRCGNDVKSKVFIYGCSGNGIKTNIPRSNIIPAESADASLTLQEQTQTKRRKQNC